MRQTTIGSLLLLVIITVRETSLQAAVTSLDVDLEPKRLGLDAPMRYFMCPTSLSHPQYSYYFAQIPGTVRP